MNKAQKVQFFTDYLRDEGYAPRPYEDGHILFKAEGMSYLVMFDEQDDVFFRIVLPNFWSIDSLEERRKVERAATKATADTKVAKIYPVEQSTWGSIELFTPSVESAARVFPRSMRALQAAVNNFKEAMNGLQD